MRRTATGSASALDGGADVVVEMDADLSHDPEVLPALVAIVEHGADVAIGSRYVPGGLTENWPWRRRALSRWGNRYVAGVLGLAVNDATAGYRAYRAEALERMDYATVTADGYGFQVEMTYRIVRIGGKVVEFPVTFRDRTRGRVEDERQHRQRGARPGAQALGAGPARSPPAPARRRVADRR